MARIETGYGTIDQRLIDHYREPCPHNVVGPGQGGIEGGLIHGAGMNPIPPGLPLRNQAFMDTEMRRELSDTHPLGITKGAALFS
ncbi:hypothetical protein [Nocardia uniformis]|uniref:hypothetical protein n=1 Tax=Nocardia uniformis TaxID=53432 RepID=UPI001FDF9E55|nr:hypothetical protein [Nocardia uniformis]